MTTTTTITTVKATSATTLTTTTTRSVSSVSSTSSPSSTESAISSSSSSRSVGFGVGLGVGLAVLLVLLILLLVLIRRRKSASRAKQPAVSLAPNPLYECAQGTSRFAADMTPNPLYEPAAMLSPKSRPAFEESNSGYAVLQEGHGPARIVSLPATTSESRAASYDNFVRAPTQGYEEIMGVTPSGSESSSVAHTYEAMSSVTVPSAAAHAYEAMGSVTVSCTEAPTASRVLHIKGLEHL
eukprot:m.235250 g.235250  ORF g.235250 m.235250 type:complete len:240 (+) comp54310_c2_seq20:636-1355(+)